MPSREPFAHSPYGELVGTEILNADLSSRTIEVSYQAHAGFSNRIGTVSGAMIAGLLDSVTGLVANQGLPADCFAVHKSMRIEYLRPAEPGRLIGRGRVLEADDRLIRSGGELYDGQDQLVASAEATLRILSRPEI